MAQLLAILDDIDPHKLASSSHSSYVTQIASATKKSLAQDVSSLLLFVESIKGCPKPCYKRDLLLEVLNQIIIEDDTFLVRILCDISISAARRIPWKEIGNTIAALPDLVANCGSLDKFSRFKPQQFYSSLSQRLYKIIETLNLKKIELGYEHKLLLAQLIARVSTTAAKKSLWTELTSKILDSKNNGLISLFADIFTIPLSSGDKNSVLFEMYIESLYLPLFYYLKPSKDSGSQLNSLLDASILHHKVFQYLVCNKHILQTNYLCDKNQQHTILLNIFAHLSHFSHKSHHQRKNVDSFLSHDENCSNGRELDHSQIQDAPLIETLLNVARSWSNSTKIFNRTYEHNRYISTALVIAFKHALAYDRENLTKNARELQSLMLKGVPVYMNRASADLRNLSMCLGELMLPELHKLIIGVNETKNDSIPVASGSSSSSTRVGRDTDANELKLNFNVELNDDCREIRRLFESDIEQMLALDNDDNNRPRDVESTNLSTSVKHDDSTMNARHHDRAQQQLMHSSKKAVIQLVTDNLADNFLVDEADKQLGREREAKEQKKKVSEGDERGNNQDRDANDDDNDGDGDDLKPYGMCRKSMIDAAARNRGGDVNDPDIADEMTMIGDQEVMTIPIYLNDCVNGLAENNNPRYVKLCLMKAGELIHQLMQQEASDIKDRTGSTSKQQVVLNPDTFVSSNKNTNRLPYVNDSIRDIACELAQLLLYLDDQFNIEGFDSYRMKALNLLCVSTPDLVVRYLLDEFNGSNRLNTRQQLEVLQVLVTSAQQLSSAESLQVFNNHLNRRDSTSTFTNATSTVGGKSGYNIVMVDSNDDHVTTVRACGGKTNKFVEYASLYFYGIVHRLKADLNGACIQPSSIVSAVRSFAAASTNVDNRRESMIRRVITGLANSKSQLSCLESPIYSRSSYTPETPTIETSDEAAFVRRRATSTTDTTSRSPTATTTTRTTSKASQACRVSSTNSCTTTTNARLIEGELERGDSMDDSYLLSRILFSISLIIKCLNHQPITCKLSNDMLDILAAYRYHPDSGVRKAIVGCLKAIRDFTPSVYFDECLHDKTFNLFGSWLATESEIIMANNIYRSCNGICDADSNE